MLVSSPQNWSKSFHPWQIC